MFNVWRPPNRQTDRSKQTAPNRQLQTDSSKQTAASRQLQTDNSSLRGILEPQKSLGSSEAEKSSIPNCFVIVLNTFGSPAHFHFFHLLVTLQLIDRQRQPFRKCLFNIPCACAGKWTPTDALEEAYHGRVEGVWSIFLAPVQVKVFNRHPRSGRARPCRRCPFNIPPACARKRTLRDSNQQTVIQTD